MIKTVVQGFQEFLSRLEVTDIDELAILQHAERVRDALAEKMDIVEDFVTGEYMRRSIIAPLEDAHIEFFYVLDTRYLIKYGDIGQALLLERIKSILQREYSVKGDISRDRNGVTIPCDEFYIDVVPGFRNKAGGFLVPHSRMDNWLPANPLLQMEIWNNANTHHNQMLLPLMKMFKCWNMKNGGLLSSFHLKCLIMQALPYYQIHQYPAAIRYVFDKARKEITMAVIDPASCSSGSFNCYVGHYNTQDNLDTALSNLKIAYAQAKSAEDFAKRGDVEQAFYYWHLLFGNSFPAWG